MPIDWTIVGKVVAILALLVATYKLVINYFHKEKEFKREDNKAWDNLVDPLLSFLDKMEREMNPLGMAELPHNHVDSISRKMNPEKRAKFKSACDNYETARTEAELGQLDIILDYSPQGVLTMKRAITEVRNVLL